MNYAYTCYLSFLLLILLVKESKSETEPGAAIVQNQIADLPQNQIKPESTPTEQKKDNKSSLNVAKSTSTSKHEFFNIIDSNHDGVINENEYEEGLTRLKEILSKPAPKSTTKILNNMIISSEKEDLSFLSAFFKSVSMIFATEVGDKTFFIAAVLSMKHDRRIIFAGAILALIIMTILSSMMGMVLPSLLPRQYTHIIGGLLFFYFGTKLLLDARSLEQNKVSDELEEVEHELMGASNKKNEEQTDLENANTNEMKEKNISYNEKIFFQALSLTFLAEWGDRSQIATIALAASKDPLGVNVGAILGHMVCTGMAVIGGRMLASSISEKTVCMFGGVVFWIFGIHSLFFES